tara:strand:- start:19 stop:1638 length:1620 start_codon:yes stop_codon:yes gene_type:complete
LKKKQKLLKTLNNERAPSLFDDDDDDERKKGKILGRNYIYPKVIPRSMLEGKKKIQADITRFIIQKQEYVKQKHLINMLIVWSERPGTGKTTMCWNSFKELKCTPHTTETVTMNSRITVHDGLKRILSAQERGHLYFFLDDLHSECPTREHIKKLISILYGRSNVTCVITIDNLYDLNMYPLRAATIGKNMCARAIKSTPLSDTEMRRAIRNQWNYEVARRKKQWEKREDIQSIHYNLTGRQVRSDMHKWYTMGAIRSNFITRTMELANGDARQASICVGMFSNDSACNAERDVSANPFEAVRAAFDGKKKMALTLEHSLLRRMVHENYPTIVDTDGEDMWNTKSDKEKQNESLDAINRIVNVASGLSDACCIGNEEEAQHLTYLSCHTTMGNKRTSGVRMRWSAYPYMKIRNGKHHIAKFAHSVPTLTDTGCIRPTSTSVLDIGMVYDLIQHRVRTLLSQRKKEQAKIITDYINYTGVNMTIFLDRSRTLRTVACGDCGQVNQELYYCNRCNTKMCKKCSGNESTSYSRTSVCRKCTG